MIVAGVLVGCLLPCTYGFYEHCTKTFAQRTKFVPLDQLSSESTSLPGSLEGLTLSEPLPVLRMSETMRYSVPSRNDVIVRRDTRSNEDFIVNVGTDDTIGGSAGDVGEDDPGVRDGLGRRLSFMEDCVYTNEDHAEERYNATYMNPIFSKAIQRPWIPTYYAEMFSIAKRACGDGQCDVVDVEKNVDKVDGVGKGGTSPDGFEVNEFVDEGQIGSLERLITK